MIKRLDKNNVYNPIREHIKMSFNVVGDKSEMTLSVASDLKLNNFDPKKSRVLIFVQTRKGTEEAVEELKKELKKNTADYANKVDFYHAGLDGQDRAEKYEDYKNGKIVILIATKAFGMGMDIKNIHFIYHLGPSSTFEDFLQEVGRAGRDPNMLKEAGYSEENPLRTRCLLTHRDFQDLKDRNHRNRIAWEEIENIRKTILSYVSKFRPLAPDTENPFPLPLDLLEQFPEFEEVFNKDTYFRVILYWLEKLGRFKLGVYTPTHLPITIHENQEDFKSITSNEDRKQLKKIHAALLEYQEKGDNSCKTVMVSMNFLKQALEEKSNQKVYKTLFKAQKAKLLTIEREIKLTPTKLRTAQLEVWDDKNSIPTIEALFDLSIKLMQLSKHGDQTQFLGNRVDVLINDIIQDNFSIDNIFWSEIKQSNNNKIEIPKVEINKALIADFKNTRAKFSFKTINFLSKTQHKSIIEIDKHDNKAKTIQLIYNGYTTSVEWENDLRQFKTELIKLIKYVSIQYFKNNTEVFNIVDLMIHLGVEEKGADYFQKLIFISKGLGFLKGGGDLVPMGIELFIHDLKEIDTSDSNSKDANIRKEFEETIKMKELRLLALECLSGRSESDFDNFIKGYFKCANQSDLIKLLEEYFGNNHSKLRAFREEALKAEKEKLNPDQEKVYKAALNRNLQVIAGPGSGKTHTLTLRIARLIQEEGINPENILVLAYNRAVVIELKERLSSLFRDLGYYKLTKRLEVHTFHSYAKKCLRIDGDSFSEWIPLFIKALENRDPLVRERMGTIRYIFVDEFQDITSERLKLLKLISEPSNAKSCVIGDPNQSIYGYDRLSTGDTMDSKPLYNEFKELYKPRELHLTINYRSFPNILEQAEKLLNLNASKFEMPKLVAFNIPNSNLKYCNFYNTTQEQINWTDKLVNLLDYKDNLNDYYKQIAVMFRSNDEVFKAFNQIKQLNLTNVRIRIQGAKGALNKTREFHYFLNVLKEKNSVVLQTNYIETLKLLKNKKQKEHANWDSYLMNVFLCLVMEFDRDREEDATYEDLAQFILEVGSKDDGQFGKIYENHIEQIIGKQQSQEIVLTTMHKVKGLEFDAVLIPPSVAKLAINAGDKTMEFIEEERRLYYVAYTRAKKRLLVIKHHREIALDKGEAYQYNEVSIRNSYGIMLKEGIDKFTMYWSAGNFGSNSFNTIKNAINIGDPIVLRDEQRGDYVFWYAYINNQKVAQLSRGLVQQINQYNSLSGFVVSAIYVHTYEETVRSDENRLLDDPNAQQYATNWTDSSKERGFIYLIDFSGYGNIN
ncbi:UvrD-helicase domain-containing protein [Lacinutrix algicola]|uniref:UvrD-helicase domain-containing protein n=1 Tax=Lacinutrix algicola TaxID=342954 RepID=UPI0006E266F3|nr:ATP-dependent helicase [Lacinutrix algicola]